jgi:CRISPR-associated endonuclease/helicase Cas3
LCPAPIGEFKKFVTDSKRKGLVWRWSFLDTKWERADEGKIVPGQVFLVHADAGGYSAERGWDPGSKDRVNPIVSPGGTKGDAPDSTEGEPLSRIGVWQTIAEHVNDVWAKLDRILKALHLTSDEAEALRHAVRWHDRGKAHEIFQRALPDGVSDTKKIWAKAPKKGWKRYERRHFRHELASALSVLDPRNDKIPDELRDLVAYLVAAHHGKVRLSIRSLPNEIRPDGDLRFARGVWDGDELPTTDLGGGVTAPAVRFSLEPMEMGLCEQEPFRGQPSWAERMIGLRNTLGPFHLAWLEAILRAADMRASREAVEREAEKKRAEVLAGRKRATP